MNSIDRLLSIKYARRFDFRKTFKFQAEVVSSIITKTLCYNLPYFLQVEINDIYTCSFTAVPIIELYTFLANFILTNFIPFCVSMICKHKRELALVKSVLAMDTWFYLRFLPFCSINLARSTLDFQNIEATWYWILVHDSEDMLLFVAVT